LVGVHTATDPVYGTTSRPTNSTVRSRAHPGSPFWFWTWLSTSRSSQARGHLAAALTTCATIADDAADDDGDHDEGGHHGVARMLVKPRVGLVGDSFKRSRFG